MSHTPAVPLSGLKPLLQRAALHARRTTHRERFYDLGFQWLCLLGILFVADLLFALPVWMRWLGLLAQLGLAGWRLWPILPKFARRHFDEQQTARLVEEGHPDVDNAFINAVQFGSQVDGASELQAHLMRREMERAEHMAGKVPVEEAVDRSGETRSMRRFAGATGVLVLVAVLFSGAFLTVIPRLFAPWMDDVTPPFSLTKIKISPAGAQVRYGDNLVISVEVAGPAPEDLTLSTRTKNGAWRDVVLDSSEPGKYSATLEGLQTDTTFYAHGGGARSAKYVATVILPPLARTISATYTFPSYLKRQPFTETVGPNGIHGVRGTKVTLDIQGNRDLNGGELDIVYDDGKEEKTALVTSPDKPDDAETRLTLTAPGEFHVALTGSDGQVNPSAAHGKIVLEQIQGPSVWFVQPEQDVLVTPTMKVAIQVDAEADAGIAHLAMHRVINGIADNPDNVFEGAPEKHVEALRTMDMADLGVRPGDVITYYAAAYDGTPGTPNLAQTEPYTLKVVSEEEYKKSLQDERTTSDLSREIKDIVNATDTLARAQQEVAKKMDEAQKALANNPNDTAAKKELAKAQADQKQLQSQAEQLAKQLDSYSKSPAADAAEAAVKKKVGEMAQQVANAAKSMQGAQSSNPSSAAQSAAKAAAQLQKAAEMGQQQAGKAAEHMEEVAKLLEDVERFKALLNRQGQLTLQAQQFQDHNPKSPEERTAMQHVAQEQGNVADELRKLQSDFRTDGAAAAKDFPKAAASAQKIADEIGRRAIPSLMDQSHGQLSQNNGPAGYQGAREALAQMEAMMSVAQSGAGIGKGELDISLSKSLGKSGLGQSFGQNFEGNAEGQGQNPGQGSGSSPSRNKGQQGDSGDSTPHAYVMRTDSITGGGAKKVTPKNRPASQADLSPDSVEVMKSSATKPPKATDSSANSYPPEYRKMVNDYFIAVSKEKRL